uniref:CCAAT/enhancer-binding protein gamma n=1 Tax=Dicentrarchus labrax TaxID=13489 RepID=A0A8P4GDK1_DICLA
MSRPQPKITTADHNAVSVIQSQAPPTPPPLPPRLCRYPDCSRSRGSSPRTSQPEEDSEEYRQRRERNNLAVKKSRMRSKQKAMDTQQRVNELKEENERLEAKIKLLSKELSVLKDLFLEHAHNLADNVNDID